MSNGSFYNLPADFLDPSWNSTVYSWRGYIPEFIREKWPLLPEDQKEAIAQYAQYLYERDLTESE